MVVARVILMLVFALAVIAIVGFVFPPTRWVELFYKSGRKEDQQK